MLRARALWLLSAAINMTLKFQLVGIENLREVQKKSSVMLAFYHGCTFPIFHYHRDSFAAILATSDSKGEVITRFAKRLHYSVFRIDEDLNSKTSARAIIQMIRFIQNKGDGALAVDGPVGPCAQVKPGIFFIAAKS